MIKYLYWDKRGIVTKNLLKSVKILHIHCKFERKDMGYIELSSVFGIALLASFGHCVGMCGGIVISLANTRLIQESSPKKVVFAHLLYVVGRVSVYMLLGAVAGGIGIIFNAVLDLKIPILLGVNILLIVFGFCLAFLPHIIRVFEPNISKDSLVFRTIAPIFTALLHSRLSVSFFWLGALNGILPCGIVYYFLLTALASGGALNGALVMGAFGLATIVVMYPFAFFSSVFMRFFHANKAVFAYLAAGAMMGFGVYGVVNGLSMMGVIG